MLALHLLDVGLHDFVGLDAAFQDIKETLDKTEDSFLHSRIQVDNVLCCRALG